MGRFWPMESKKKWVFLAGEGCLKLICLKVDTNRRYGWASKLGLNGGQSLIILSRVEVLIV